MQYKSLLERKNDSQDRLTISTCESLYIFNQKKGDDAIQKLINVLFVATEIFIQLDT